ncbi:hypothetical protein CCH79_00005099, partial [Gambusia affinis]
IFAGFAGHHGEASDRIQVTSCRDETERTALLRELRKLRPPAGRTDTEDLAGKASPTTPNLLGQTVDESVERDFVKVCLLVIPPLLINPLSSLCPIAAKPLRLGEATLLGISDKIQLLLDFLVKSDVLVTLNIFLEVVCGNEPESDALRQEYGLEEGAAGRQNQTVAGELLVLDFQDTVHKLVIVQKITQSILEQGLLVHPRLPHRVYCQRRHFVGGVLFLLRHSGTAGAHWPAPTATNSLNVWYADPVADLLDQWGVFRARLFRESCVFHRGNYVKDLSRLGRELNNVIIVDNSPASYIFHPENAVPVQSWFDDMNDTELLDLLPFFEGLSKEDEVYGVLQNFRSSFLFAIIHWLHRVWILQQGLLALPFLHQLHATLGKLQAVQGKNIVEDNSPEIGSIEDTPDPTRHGFTHRSLLLQGKAHAAHDAEATASIEQDVLQVKRSGHQGFLQGESAIPELQAQKLYTGCRDSSVFGRPKRKPPTHLPGVIRLQLDGGQRAQTCSKAHPLLLDQGDAVQYDAVGHNQSHEGPAHGDQDG